MRLSSAITAMALATAALTLGQDAAAAPLRVCVSVPPLRGLAERVGGESVTVSAFMDENQDPHTFSPAPRAVADLGQCALFFGVGIDFEAALIEKVKRTFPQLEIVNVSAGLARTASVEQAGHEAAAGDEGGHDGAEADHHDHLSDPHLWLSLPNLSQMAGRMAEALARRLPEQRAVIERNLAALKADLAAAHADLSTRLAPLRGSTFYVYHPSFGYFARDYGLVQEAVEIDGKAPSPRQLAALIEQARREKVNVIFVQPQFAQRSANILAERIGGEVVPLNPLSTDVVGVLRQAAQTLVRARAKR